MKECKSGARSLIGDVRCRKAGMRFVPYGGVVRLVWSEGCVVRAGIEVIHQGQNEVSSGIVK